MKKQHPIVMLPADNFTAKAPEEFIGSLFLNKDNVASIIKDEESVVKSYIWFKAIPQYLYILSTEEIKEGDWVYRSDNNSIFKAGSTITLRFIESPNLMGAEGVQKKYCSKVIVTTNSELTRPEAKVSCPRCKSTLEVHLPDHLKCSNKECEWTVWNIVNGIYNDVKPSSVAKIVDSFLPIYAEAYNAGKPIEMVELEYYPDKCDFSGGKMCVKTDTGRCSKCSGLLKLNQDNTVNISLIEERMFTKDDMEKAFWAGTDYQNGEYQEGFQNSKPTFEDWIKKHYPS